MRATVTRTLHACELYKLRIVETDHIINLRGGSGDLARDMID